MSPTTPTARSESWTFAALPTTHSVPWVPDYGRMRPLLEIEERDGLVSFHVGGKAVRGAEV